MHNLNSMLPDVTPQRERGTGGAPEGSPRWTWNLQHGNTGGRQFLESHSLSVVCENVGRERRSIQMKSDVAYVSRDSTMMQIPRAKQYHCEMPAAFARP